MLPSEDRIPIEVKAEAEDKLDPESAEIEFYRFVDCMDLDLDLEDMNGDEEDTFKKSKKLLIKALCKGHLIVNDDGEMVYTCKNTKSNYDKPIQFSQISGSARLAMDKSKESHVIKKTYTMMGHMCGIHGSVFNKLVGVDLRVCEAIFGLLMG